MKQLLLMTLLAAMQISTAGAQDFSLGKYDTLHSEILDEERRILVHVPEGGISEEVRYPVMYLLDGESHFTKTIGILDHLSRTAGNEVCPQMIVVAIFHTNREKDLVPPDMNSKHLVLDNFAHFLEKELIPFVDSRYPTEPYRVFVGHSLGGLRVVNTFVYQPHLFQSYIALDPSLGHVPYWISNANAAFDESNPSNKSLYIAMGQTMPAGMDTLAIQQDTTSHSRHMRSIMSFAKNVEAHKKNGLDFNWKYYPNESHQSVVFMGTHDGLVANFSWFENEKLYDIFKPEVGPEASVKIIVDYYSRISEKMGYTILAPEAGTSGLIDYLTYKKWYDKALAFAEFNVKTYPSSKHALRQLEQARWNTKKSLAALMQLKSAKEISQLCKKEAKKKEPEYNISEEALNTLGYNLMAQNKMDEAKIIFETYVALYPNSANAYDSYGECLLNMGQKKEGLEAYKKSLELDPRNTNAARVLEKHN